MRNIHHGLVSQACQRERDRQAGILIAKRATERRARVEARMASDPDVLACRAERERYATEWASLLDDARATLDAFSEDRATFRGRRRADALRSASGTRQRRAP